MRRRVGRRQGRPVPQAPRPCRQSHWPEESERRKATYMAKGLRERVGKQYKGTQRTRKAVHGECTVELAKWTFPIISLFREPYEAKVSRTGLTGGMGKRTVRQRALCLPSKAGWYTVLADPKMPAMSTVVDQAHNALDRTLFAMKGFHHPGGSHTALLTGFAHLYNLIPYQRRALNAGRCGVEVEGGRVPTSDWMLNLQILTSGGFR